MPGELPEQLRRFILTSVPSVSFVEALLLFKAAAPSPVSTTTIAHRLYTTEAAAALVVAQLEQARIIRAAAPGEEHLFMPATPELADRLDTLASYYASHLLEVTNVIHSITARRAQQFADAFRLRKET